MIETLAAALPRATFVEEHSRVVDAPPERVWAVLAETRWSDLRFSGVLFAVRGLDFRRTGPRVLDDGPVRGLLRSEPVYSAAGRIARPWKPVPVLGPDVETLDELHDFDDPAWLKMGLDFRLDTLPDGRTLLSTSTRCEATDDAARRRFALYWRVIRPFSGLIRRELLATIARRAETAP